MPIIIQFKIILKITKEIKLHDVFLHLHAYTYISLEENKLIMMISEEGNWVASEGLERDLLFTIYSLVPFEFCII